MENNIFATRLNQAREKSGLSLRALSQTAEVSPQSMSQYAKGDAMPPLRSAIKIAEKLGVSLDWLCGLQEEPAPVVEDEPIKTYGEFLEAALKLLYTQGLDTAFDVHDSIDGTTVHLYFSDNDILSDFFRKEKKFSDLFQGDEDERTLIREWTEGRIKALNNKRIVPAAVETDELPF